VVSDRAGRLLTHPERALLLQPLGTEPRLRGFEAVLSDGGGGNLPGPQAGSAVADSAGSLVFKAVEPLSGWQVWRAVPRAEVLAPLQAAWRSALPLAALATLALTCLLGLFLVWQLRPLAQLQQRAQGLLRGDLAAAEGWPEVGGEIGQLSRTLRHVSAERAQVEAFNTQVMQRLGSVMAASPVGLAFTRHGRFELVSAELCALFQRSEDALLGQPTQLIFASNEDYAGLGPKVSEAFARGEPYLGEWRMLRADTTSFWGRLRARPVDGEANAALVNPDWFIKQGYAISRQMDPYGCRLSL
jgi:PAS domain-containing protein